MKTEFIFLKEVENMLINFLDEHGLSNSRIECYPDIERFAEKVYDAAQELECVNDEIEEMRLNESILQDDYDNASQAFENVQSTASKGLNDTIRQVEGLLENLKLLKRDVDNECIC